MALLRLREIGSFLRVIDDLLRATNEAFRVIDCYRVARPDKPAGYEYVAAEFIAGRGSNSSGVGASVVADWSRTLPSSATVLDLGCGTGVPISQALIERGFKVYAVDASPTIAAAFCARFPGVPVECADVEHSEFFARTFDGVVAWGLFFLLDEELQRKLIKRVAGVLQSGGRLLFTAPKESGSFPPDVMTGRPQFSLGYAEYRKALEAEDMLLIGTHRDAGENHYYFARRA
jgi:SAM-dependent methyltransferase